MKDINQGKLRSGRSGKRVINPKHAIAIGLSDADQAGAKITVKATKKNTRGKDLRFDLFVSTNHPHVDKANF